MMACVNPKDIPKSLLPKGQSRKKEIDAIGTLEAYSFISKRVTNEAFDIHRLVHLATTNWLRKQDLVAQWTKKTITQLNKIFPTYRQNRSVWRRYLPHVQYAIMSDTADQIDFQRIWLEQKYHICLIEDGRYNEAETCLLDNLKIKDRLLGHEHPDALASMGNLGILYQHQGRYKEAEDLQIHLLEKSKRVLGLEHPDTLKSSGNLACTFRNQGRLNEAEDLQIQVLKTRKRVLGLEHPDTLKSSGNLACTLRNQGRLNKAEDLQIQVLETRKRVLGLDHPDTLVSMQNLALIWRANGKAKEAVVLMEDCFRRQESSIGTDHPSTKNSLNCLQKWYEIDTSESTEISVGS